MFDPNGNKPSPVKSITITRVRNGFMLIRSDQYERGIVSEPYVFNDLCDLYDFLIEQDFECKDE